MLGPLPNKQYVVQVRAPNRPGALRGSRRRYTSPRYIVQSLPCIFPDSLDHSEQLDRQQLPFLCGSLIQDPARCEFDAELVAELEPVFLR